MPTSGIRFEDELIRLFLSMYENQSWAGPRATSSIPDRASDGGIDCLATRLSDNAYLAIEHTVIQPFPGEKTDFHAGFKEIQARLRQDRSLYRPGVAIYLLAPQGLVPRKVNAGRLGEEIANGLRDAVESFADEYRPWTCKCPSHPQGEVVFMVRLAPIGKDSQFLIVQRYGEGDLAGSIRKALAAKLPKLVGTPATKRILMLERDQAMLSPDDIRSEIQRQRPVWGALAAIDELWIADTANFESGRTWVEFSLANGLTQIESFAFYRGQVHSWSRMNRPLPLPVQPT